MEVQLPENLVRNCMAKVITKIQQRLCEYFLNSLVVYRMQFSYFKIVSAQVL